MNSFFSIDNTTVMLIPLAPSRLKPVELVSWSGADTAIAIPEKPLYTWREGVRGTTVASTGMFGTELTLELIPNSPNTVYMMNVVRDRLNNIHHMFNLTVTCHDVGDLEYRYQRGFITTSSLGQSLGSGPAAPKSFPMFFERVDFDYTQAAFPVPLARPSATQ